MIGGGPVSFWLLLVTRDITVQSHCRFSLLTVLFPVSFLLAVGARVKGDTANGIQNHWISGIRCSGGSDSCNGNGDRMHGGGTRRPISIAIAAAESVEVRFLLFVVIDVIE